MRNWSVLFAMCALCLLPGYSSVNADNLYSAPVFVPAGGQLACVVWNVTANQFNVTIQVYNQQGSQLSSSKLAVSGHAMQWVYQSGPAYLACKFAVASAGTIRAALIILDGVTIRPEVVPVK